MIGKIIREKIEFMNLTQGELSLLTGISEKHLSDILNDKELLSSETSAAIGKIFGVGTLSLLNMQERKIKLNTKLTPEEEVILKYAQSLDNFKLTDVRSVRMIIDSFIPGKNLSTYKNYLNKSVVGFRKYKDKPLAYLWIALMENKYCELKSEGTFKKSSKETVYKNVLDIILDNLSFNEKLISVKKYLSKAGIVLMEGPFIKDSTINGVALERGHQKFIFISDMDKREHVFITSLMHELVHFYENIDHDNEKIIDDRVEEIISKYMSKYFVKNHDLTIYFSALKMNLKDKELFDYLHANTKAKINFGLVDKLFDDNYKLRSI